MSINRLKVFDDIALYVKLRVEENNLPNLIRKTMNQEDKTPIEKLIEWLDKCPPHELWQVSKEAAKLLSEEKAYILSKEREAAEKSIDWASANVNRQGVLHIMKVNNYLNTHYPKQ